MAEKRYVAYEGEKLSLKTFTNFSYYDGQCYMMNPKNGLKIEFNIDNKDDISAFGINEHNLKLFRTQVDRATNTGRLVPDGYEKKYCVLFSGKVFHSFDTKEQLEAFRNDDTKNVGLTYAFYYPPN